jgi:hypothetical protein
MELAFTTLTNNGEAAHDKELDAALKLWQAANAAKGKSTLGDRALAQSRFADLIQELVRLRFPVPAEAWFGPRRERA